MDSTLESNKRRREPNCLLADATSIGICFNHVCASYTLSRRPSQTV